MSMEAFLLSCVSSSDPQVIESANLAEDLLGTQGITIIEILVHRIKSSTLSYPDFENYLSSVGFGIGHIGKIRYKVKQMVMDLEDKELELLVSGAMYGDSPSSQTITDRGDTTANPLAHGAAAGGSAEKSPQEQLAEAQKVMMNKIAAATAKGDNHACVAATQEYATLAQNLSAEMMTSAVNASFAGQMQSQMDVQQQQVHHLLSSSLLLLADLL